MIMKNALVCGASQGIGAETARQLARSGFKVTLFARNQENLKEVRASLPGEGHHIIAGDISRPETWQKAITERHQQAPLSVLILNSGGPKGGPISKAAPEEFLQAMNQHLVANSLILQTVLPSMKANAHGRVVTVTSTSVKMPIPHLGVSNTARAAVAAWAKTLSFELAPFNITVNNVMPGYTDTPRLHSLMKAKAESSAVSIDEVRREWQKSVPMNRFASPEETAHLIDFLVSEKAGYITGQNIAVDGGRLGCL